MTCKTTITLGILNDNTCTIGRIAQKMCGIAGFYGLDGDEKSNIVRILETIVHRGPDAEGMWIDPCGTGLTLGHRRLSIIDLTETGSQPMLSHSKRYVIAYNGEIYNHRSLMDEMRKDGYMDAMNGTSDTEVLVEALEFYGVEKAINKCKGMFAIALYDREERILYLLRDRIGEKPLYYSICGESLVFCSEIAGISEIRGFAEELNYNCIEDYLKYGYIPAPYTIYKNVYKLEPGCILTIDLKNKSNLNNLSRGPLGQAVSKPYWDINEVAVNGQKNKFSGNREEAASELERLLRESIKGQMVADVPLGAFLSAGIDSSTVVALMQTQASQAVRTFTIGFEDKEYNEASEAAEIAAHLGTDHTQLYVTKQDALDVIPKLPSMFGEPFADSSQIPTYLVSRMTRQHVTVSLSGDGGDELFAGYRDYKGVYNIYNKIKSIPYPVRFIAGSLMEAVPSEGKGRSIHAHGTLMKAKNPADLYRRTYETDPLTGKLMGNGVLLNRDYKIAHKTCVYDEFNPKLMGEDPIHTAMLMNMQMYHSDDILAKVDRTAMAVSLVTRVPMLDKDVVEFAWTLPLDYVRNDNEGKLVLRDVLYKYVPRELMDRPKKGFSVPVAKWLKEDGLNTWAQEMLNADCINRHNVLGADAVNKLWNDYMDKGIWRPQIWYVLMLQAWLEDRNIK